MMLTLLRHWPAGWRRYKTFMRHWRRHFISPAETNFIRIMGGFAFVLPIDDSAGNPLTFIYMGRWLKKYGCVHQCEVRGYHIDFGFTRKRGIEVDGRYDRHGNKIHDVVEDQQRDEHLLKSNWHILRVPAIWCAPNSRHYQPDRVRAMVETFVVPNIKELPVSARQF